MLLFLLKILRKYNIFLNEKELNELKGLTKKLNDFEELDYTLFLQEQKEKTEQNYPPYTQR